MVQNKESRKAGTRFLPAFLLSLFRRMEVADLAGNIGLSQTREPVLVDLAKPSVAIVNIKPAAN
ncbi:MAG TPA: hypothetical protein VGX70_14675 [Gemmataceae bacterium]|nr:hypothetical protein [Gemmataceae bacterium]